MSAPIGRCECRDYQCPLNTRGGAHSILEGRCQRDAVRLVPVFGVRDFLTYPTAHTLALCEPCASHAETRTTGGEE